MPNDEPIASLILSAEPLTAAWFTEDASDAILLDRFVEQWDQAAFHDLMGRHGPMVLGVCRRILRDPHAAEDAFQATFLLLVRKASSVPEARVGRPLVVRRRPARRPRGARSHVAAPDGGKPGSGGSWRHRPRRLGARRVARGPPRRARPAPGEISALPLVICYLEGLPHEAVARRLGWPLGTVRTRIAGARPAGRKADPPWSGAGRRADRLGSARENRSGGTPAAGRSDGSGRDACRGRGQGTLEGGPRPGRRSRKESEEVRATDATGMGDGDRAWRSS